MKTRMLILVLMFVLLVPLYIAADNLTIHEKRELKTSSIIMSISTNSDWARISFNGATIHDYTELGKTAGLKEPIIDSTGIIINRFKESNGTETLRLKLELGIFDENVVLATSKEYGGAVNINIEGVGAYENNKNPLHVPVTIETTSDWTKIELSGADIRKAQLLEVKGNALREPIMGTKSIILAKIKGNDSSFGSAKFALDLSLDTPMPLVTIEKADNGMTRTFFGESMLENNITSEEIFRNIPFTIETTSNLTEIDFQGIYLKRAKPVEVDKQSLNDLVIGSNFIFLNYSHGGNTYRKAGYLIDMGLTENPSRISILKKDPGYTVVNLGLNTYANLEKEKANKSISYPVDLKNISPVPLREPLFELDAINEEKNTVRNLPISIETTSDWTEITLKDVNIINAEIKGITGDIEKPGTGGNTILIKKPKTYDNSLATLEILLQINLDEKFLDKRKGTITMSVAKGDIGATTVRIKNMDHFVNAEKIRNDPRNVRNYEIPLHALQNEEKNGNNILYEPQTYSVPLINELRENNLDFEDTQNMQTSFLIKTDHLPGKYKMDFGMRRPEAVGLLSFVVFSYFVLFILGIHVLSKEGFFDFIPSLIGEDKATIQTIGSFAIKLFEKIPASSLFILEALIILGITPFVLMVDQTYAEGTAILAYFLLVFGVLLRVVGQSERANKIFQWQEFPMVMFLIKTASLFMILSSLVVAGYELMGLYGAIALFLPGLLFVFLVFRYLKEHFETGNHAAEW